MFGQFDDQWGPPDAGLEPYRPGPQDYVSLTSCALEAVEEAIQRATFGLNRAESEPWWDAAADFFGEARQAVST